MKYLFIFYICINSIITYSQNNNVTIIGKVVDMNNIPITNVTVKYFNNNTGAITNNQGYFYLNVNDFPVKIEVSRIGFKKKVVSISKDVYNSIDTFLLVKMEEKVYPLEEVEIVNGKSNVIVSNNNNWFILDFKISRGKIIVLLKKNGKRKIKILDVDTWLSNKIPIKVNGNELFEDCLNNIHILTNDSIYQIKITDTTINIYKAFSKTKFSNTLKICVGRINNKFIFKSVSKHNQAIKYWYIADKKKQIFYNVYDEDRFLFAQRFLDRKNELIKKYGVLNELGDITVTQLHIIRKIRQLEFGYQFLGKIPAYNPIFINNDTILIFDNVNKSIVFLDSSFSIVKKVPILYPTKNNNIIYQDKITGKFYTESNQLVKNEFYEIDLSTGKTSEAIKINNCIFPEKVVFYGNKIFYIDNSNRNKSLKVLTIK